MRVRSYFAAVCVALVVSACGGGGGGSSSGGITPGGGNGNGNGGGSSLSQTSVQRSDAEGALVGVETYRSYSDGGSPTTLTSLRRTLSRLGKHAMLLHERSATTCENDSEISEVAGTNGTEIFTIDDYYDSMCTQLEDSLVWTASAQGDDITGPATFTQYSTSGAITGTADAVITFVYTNSSLSVLSGISFLLTDVTENGSTSSGSIGLACSETAAGATGECSVAVTENVAALSEELGAVATISLASSNQSIAMQIAAYQGAENALAIASGTFPAWTISPASDVVASDSIAGGATSGGGFTLTLTDNTNGGTLAIVGSSSGTVNGTLTNTATGSTVATFTIDSSGDGTLTYSSGTQVSIVDYIVQG